MYKNWFLKTVIGTILLLFVILFFDTPFLNAQSCINNFQCGPGQYCKKQTGNCLGWGVCAERPESCIWLNRMYSPYYQDPVCGCDGRNYSSTCEAASYGVNVAYLGQCRTSSSNPYWQNWYFPGYWDSYWQNWYNPNSWYYPGWNDWYNPYWWNWYDPWQNWYNPSQGNLTYEEYEYCKSCLSAQAKGAYISCPSYCDYLTYWNYGY